MNKSEQLLSAFAETMFKEVMGIRANEQEFVARQKQKWYRAFVASEALCIT